MPPDAYLDARLGELERLVAERSPDDLSANVARTLCCRVRSYRSRGYLHTAPRLRRHVLSDLRDAIRALQRTSA